MSSELQWHAEREQLRAALDAPDGRDLAAAAAELRRRNGVLEADNSRLRAHLATARLLASESAKGAIEAADPSVIPADGTSEAASGESNLSLVDALGCADCRGHLGGGSMVIDACASVAYETSQPIGRVLAEYLLLHHQQQGHR